jgi:hypothetical protein
MPSIRGRSWPAVAGAALAALGVAVGSCVALLSGSPAQSAGAAADPGRLPASRATAVSPAALASATPGRASAAGPDGAASQATAALTGATTPKLIVPDVIASVPGGVTPADLARLRKLPGVRATLAIDGARITVNSARLTVLAAPAAALRPWLPPATAGSQQTWAQFAAGDLIADPAGATAANLREGSTYPAEAAVATLLTVGTPVLLGITGVDAVVSPRRARQLGLVRNVAVLVNAPAADMIALTGQVHSALGSSSRVIRLVPVTVPTALPVDSAVPSGRPTSYLQLFKAAAALYCPGLSWTVLAAIGQIESADGQNMGPSTAGALGPMQFLPSTWAAWGIDGFGDTGPPDIMNPFDAVPSAARLLCADGAAQGGQQLRQAIFDYNHATWYVDEVLTLAAEYAHEYG